MSEHPRPTWGYRVGLVAVFCACFIPMIALPLVLIAMFFSQAIPALTPEAAALIGVVVSAVMGWRIAVLFANTAFEASMRDVLPKGPVCSECGYSLEGLVGERCPECGGLLYGR